VESECLFSLFYNKRKYQYRPDSVFQYIHTNVCCGALAINLLSLLNIISSHAPSFTCLFIEFNFILKPGTESIFFYFKIVFCLEIQQEPIRHAKETRSRPTRVANPVVFKVSRQLAKKQKSQGHFDPHGFDLADCIPY